MRNSNAGNKIKTLALLSGNEVEQEVELQVIINNLTVFMELYL
jgi:hypothetical protein